MITIHHPWVFVFGLLGNIISFMLYLAPLPTFIRVYKKKSTEGFQSVPYVVAIFSAMLWIYYALLKGNAVLLITINIAGVIIETLYIAVYITYAPKQAKISTIKLLLLLNLGGFCLIVLLCHYLAKGGARVQVLGWICVAFSISVFAAPLSIMKLVVRTKSVEFMPFNLSLCLTLTAVIWFMFGMLQKDLYITLPNVVGFIFGVAQMLFYGIYRKYDKEAEKPKLPEEVQSASPVINQHINDTYPSGSLPKTQETIEIEVIVVGNTNIEESNEDHKEIFHGPPQEKSCNMDRENIPSWAGPATIQLVECVI